MKSHRTDTAYSWLVAFCAFAIFFVQYGFHRTYGIYYAESISYFQTSREAASYCYILITVMKIFAGPMSGFLYHLLGMRQVILLGSFISFLGIALCFLATDIIYVIIFWGIFYGIGATFATSLLLQAVNLYFKKHVSKACGLALAGGSVAGILLPSLFQFLFEKYGLSGAYLLSAAVALHCIPVGMLIRNPISINARKIFPKNQDKLHERSLEDEVKSDDFHQKNCEEIGNDANVLEKSQTKLLSRDTLFKDKVCNDTSSEEQISSTHYNMTPSNANYDIKDDNNGVDLEEREKLEKENKYDDTRKYDNQATLILEKQDETCIQKCESSSIGFEHQNEKLYNKCSVHARKSFQGMENFDVPKSNRNSCHFSKKYKRLFKPFKVFYNPSFIFLAIVQGSTFYRFTILSSIIIDYSKDKGISADESKYFLMGVGFLDLFAKLGLGWITDGGYVTRRIYHASCSLFSAVILGMIVWLRDFTSLLVCISLEGMLLGTSMTVMPALVCSYVKKEQQAVALSSASCVLFPLYISSSSIIGYFRDDLGSYDILVYILMSIGLMQMVLILSLPVVDRWWKKKTKRVRHDMI